jgi:acetyl-CoA carboxylase biotin carboxyl carrier protein
MTKIWEILCKFALLSQTENLLDNPWIRLYTLNIKIFETQNNLDLEENMMEFENLITLIHTVSTSKLTEFAMEGDGIQISMKADRGMKIAAVPAAGQMTGAEVSAETEEEDAAAAVEGETVKSPLVGMFYNAQSPEAEPFVKVGDPVKKGQTLGIVEAMKLMNEIASEYDGVVKEILVKNEQAVEYGQPLFVIG